MDDDRGVRLEANAKAHRAMSKAAGISWPLPADRRLDQLVKLANDAEPPPECRTISATGVTVYVLASCVQPGSGSDMYMADPSSRLTSCALWPVVPCLRLHSSSCSA